MKLLAVAGGISTALLLVLSVISPFSKMFWIGWIALLAMLGGALAALKKIESLRAVVWSYGLSGGASFASIIYFVLPRAFNLSSLYGGIGLVTGFMTGLALHSISHESSHSSKGLNTLWSISLHAAAAGTIMGLIYQQLPGLSVLLGLAIVSHKLPAGFMITERLEEHDASFWMAFLFPASVVGTAGLLAFNYPVALENTAKAAFFGFSSGIFLHVALDFLPEPEPESNLRKLVTSEEDPEHENIEKLNRHTIASAVTGAAIVTVAALTI